MIISAEEKWHSGRAMAAIFRLMSATGTKRTNWAGLIMSVDWGRPEVAGGPSNRRF
jgi:hypothetical protein